MDFKEIYVKSSLDGSDQPSMFYKAEGECRPLLVGLHTWSYDRRNQMDNLLPLAKKHGFDLLLPEFRGPNLVGNPNREKACGSEYAVADVVDAIEYVTRVYGSDKSRVLLIGLSGGGHMALMMAGTHPELFLATAAPPPQRQNRCYPRRHHRWRGRCNPPVQRGYRPDAYHSRYDYHQPRGRC